jgi:transcriptional regulator of acetoin/glycerol metabolism
MALKPARSKHPQDDHRSPGTDELAAFSDLFSRLVSTKSRPPTMDELEHAYLVWLLRFTLGNRTAASRLLGVSYPTIMKKIRDYRIDFKAFARAGRTA